MNQDQFNEHLKKESTSSTQQKIVDRIINSVKEASLQSDMRVETWAEADQLYRGYRLMDKKDKEDVVNKKPPKILIPLSYALSQTSLSFLMSTFFGQERLYRLRGSGPEDQRIKEAYEIDLEYQLNKEKAILKFYLWMQDAYKYGVGILEDCWEEEHQQFRVKQPTAETSIIRKAFNALTNASPQETYEEVVKSLKVFEGVRLRNVNPFTFYSDPNVTISNIQQGDFVICEDETSLSEVKSKEGTVYYGTEHIENFMTHHTFSKRNHRVGSNTIFKKVTNLSSMTSGSISMKSDCIKTRYEFTTTPRELKEDFDYEVDKTYDENSQIKMVAVCINDQKLVKFQPLGYLHNMYSYNTIEYSPDHINYTNPGLIDTIYNLEHRMTWYLNAQAQNVKKAIQNRIIVNQALIETDDLDSGKTYIRTKQGITPTDINKAIYSFEVNDMTRNHLVDIQALQGFAQLIVGVSDAALGRFNSGRRSAREAGNVDNAYSARITMQGRLFWANGFEPLGQKMIANTNQLRSEKYYNHIIGEDIVKYPYEEVIQFNPESIANGFDFIAYEGQTPSDRDKQAFHYTELLKTLLSNPRELTAITQLDISKVIGKVFNLYGIKNLDDFKLNPQQMQQNLEATVIPDAKLAQVQRELQQVEMPEQILSSLTQ